MTDPKCYVRIIHLRQWAGVFGVPVGQVVSRAFLPGGFRLAIWLGGSELGLHFSATMPGNTRLLQGYAGRKDVDLSVPRIEPSHSK